VELVAAEIHSVMLTVLLQKEIEHTLMVWIMGLDVLLGYKESLR